MKRKKETTDAIGILHRRYIKDDPERKASLEAERVNAHIARIIYDLRREAGLSQKGLAELIGTTQSVISRLEDSDYEGHSLSMLNRIAKALNQNLTVVMTAQDPEAGELRHAFQVFLHNLRKNKGLTYEALAKKSGIDRNEIMAMERVAGYRPSPLALRKLSQVYKIPGRRLAELAGAIQPSPAILDSASRFAAKSESSARLTKEEKKILDEFVKVLREEASG